MNKSEIVQARLTCLIEATKIKQTLGDTEKYKNKGVVEIAKELESFVINDERSEGPMPIKTNNASSEAFNPEFGDVVFAEKSLILTNGKSLEDRNGTYVGSRENVHYIVTPDTEVSFRTNATFEIYRCKNISPQKRGF